jgi:AcrR family transcriptional regulator
VARRKRARKPGRPPRSEAAPASVEQRILDSACSLFYEEGLHAVGVDRVLAEAGAAKASLYAHYSSKDELVAAYLSRQAAEWRKRAAANLAETGGGRAGLLRLFDLIEESRADPGFRGCPFQNAVSELPDRAHPAREVARSHRACFQSLVRELVDEAGVRDAARVARAIVVLHDGAIASAVLDGDARGVAAARFAAETLLDASARRSAEPRQPASESCRRRR